MFHTKFLVKAKFFVIYKILRNLFFQIEKVLKPLLRGSLTFIKIIFFLNYESKKKNIVSRNIFSRNLRYACHMDSTAVIGGSKGRSPQLRNSQP